MLNKKRMYIYSNNKNEKTANIKNLYKMIQVQCIASFKIKN